MKNVDLLAGRYPRVIGLARYTASLEKAFNQIGFSYRRVEPSYPWFIKTTHALLKPFGYDVKTFFTTYPVSAQFQHGAVHHLTTQMMASILNYHPKLDRVVVTVHDIVPYLMRDDPEQSDYAHFYDRVIDRNAMFNLRKADRIIAISSYTKDMLVTHLSCDGEKIRVNLYGMDHQIFRPVSVNDAIREKYGLDPSNHNLLYVGSELPRKNLPRLIEALAKVKTQMPNIKLFKVGTPESKKHFQRLLQRIIALDLQDSVVFINHPPQEDLVALYCAADLFVFPSLYEGFGMPPLEALACGTPVICSSAPPMPEVVGEAAILVDPLDADAWAPAILQLLGDEGRQQQLRQQGFQRAAAFTWEQHAKRTINVYEELF